MGIPVSQSVSGELEVEGKMYSMQSDQIREFLQREGFELLEGRKGILVRQIKDLILDLARYSENPLTINLSQYLSEKLNYDYTYLSNIFRSVEGSTIEKFYILHKIERVKELLLNYELTLTQIAYKMNYSSLSHLSTQFKKVTGISVSHFKQLNKWRSIG